MRSCLVLISGTIVWATTAGAADQVREVRFDRDVRPILSEYCFPCHGADANKRKAKLRLDIPNGTTEATIIVPGKPEESELVTRIFSKDGDEQMPPADSKRHLTEEQKQVLRVWIKGGAKYEEHWAFKAPSKPALPTVKKRSWPRSPIDTFVLARLEREGLSPSKQAPVERLLRRVSFDLTGLPPSPEQMKKWLGQHEPYVAAVDELLASSRFGERMATDWMDLARYADTHGFNNDSQRTMWRWRDWVIEAFNQNVPYDRFLTEQLAGDLLERPTLEQRIATGFNRNHVVNSEGGLIDEEYRVEYVADRVKTTAMAWMGLTMECARCHDHKFDPVTQKEYYRFFAFFNSNDEFGEDGRVGNAAPILAAPTTMQQEAATKQREGLRVADEKMKKLLATSLDENWVKTLRASDEELELLKSTNVVVALDLAATSGESKTITNLGGGNSFNASGAVVVTNGPLAMRALVFDGATSLKADGLRKSNTGKGWALSAWVRRDAVKAGTLFSTMNFDVPESSESYGRGIEVRFTAEGAIEVRIARRWPAYSMNLITRDTVPVGEWRNILVTCDGPTVARGVRVFVDGQESFREILHDNNNPELAISGAALIGSSNERNSKPFVGALADLRLIGQPFDVDKLAAQAAGRTLSVAVDTPADARQPYQQELLKRAQSDRDNPEFARAVGEARKARAALLELERESPSTMVMRELSQPRPSFVLYRGQYDQPRERVEPGVPEFLLPFPANAPRNRLGLAQWLTDPKQPMTARVVVNHFWQSIFGTGIVKSVEDFGYQADWPSHPELLDWLASEFVESGWDVKKLVRLMVTSATYCQNSDSSNELNERDPENRLLARGPRQRLTAEMLRDQAIALSGLLQEEIGGPPVYPYQPTNLYKGIVVAADYPGTSYTDSKGTALYRRSLYTFWKRTVPHPTLATFDAPDREVCVARRLRTNTPLQALALMNDPIQLEAARKLAERMVREGGVKAGSRLDFAFQLAMARKPRASERKQLNALLEKRLTYYRANPQAAKDLLSVGASAVDAKLDAAELAAYANVASLILNLDETITRN